MTDYPLPNASHDLTGEVALITGATSGLGWHFARVLANAGAKVAIAGRRAERLEELKKQIEQDGGTAHCVPADMLDDESILHMIESTEQELGMITIAINNAGMADGLLATKIETRLIDELLGVNVRAPFIIAREVAKRLIKAKRGGKIINMSSIAAYYYPSAGAALYATSKAAIARMTEALAIEWAGYNINVNAIAPGLFKSEMSDGLQERAGEVWHSYARGRICDPAMLDSTLLYLCSAASEAVTGTIIKVDDGQMPR